MYLFIIIMYYVLLLITISMKAQGPRTDKMYDSLCKDNKAIAH